MKQAATHDFKATVLKSSRAVPKTCFLGIGEIDLNLYRAGIARPVKFFVLEFSRS